MVRAAEIGREEGLRFVYAGNRPGGVGDWENTRCPGCNALLIERGVILPAADMRHGLQRVRAALDQLGDVVREIAGALQVIVQLPALRRLVATALR